MQVSAFAYLKCYTERWASGSLKTFQKLSFTSPSPKHLQYLLEHVCQTLSLCETKPSTERRLKKMMLPLNSYKILKL